MLVRGRACLPGKGYHQVRHALSHDVILRMRRDNHILQQVFASLLYNNT